MYSAVRYELTGEELQGGRQEVNEDVRILVEKLSIF